VQLETAGVRPYLVEQGVLGSSDEAVVEPLPGGFVNRVFRVTAGGRSFVVKQGLAESERTLLRADVRRALMEAAAMQAIGELLGDDALIPALLHHDPGNFVTVMTAAPRDAVLYEPELLGGRFHRGVPSQVGAYAARLHAVTRDNTEIRTRFADNPGFALRDQSIRSASRHNPDLTGRLASLLARNRAEASALVDADITPKNVLVHGHAITKLDFECTQWGDPALDVGIVVAHYVLIAFARPAWRDAVMGEAEGFLAAYEQTGPEPLPAAFLQRSCEYAAAMMLGRVDGDLVLEYAGPHRDPVNRLARCLLAAPPASRPELAAVVGEALAREGAAGGGVVGRA
jgi:aminoglycoside phosphotransferase (APT) family kinase protein